MSSAGPQLTIRPERIELHQVDAPVGGGVARAAVADENRAIGRCGDGRQAMQRLAFDSRRAASCGPSRRRPQARARCTRARRPSGWNVSAPTSLSNSRTRRVLVAGTAQPPHLVAGGNADRAVRCFGDRISAGKRLADLRRVFEPIVRAERAVHRGDRVWVAILEKYLFEVAAQVSEKAHRITPAACCPNRPQSRSRSDRNARDRA